MVTTISKNNIKWGPVGKAVYERTYSRTKPDGSKETWPETVARVVDGNLGLVDKKFWRRGERQELFDLLLNFKALPAGRHLWVSGVKGRQFLFNCFDGKTKVHTDAGIFPIKDLVGKNVNVLSQGGVYRNAKIKEFGEQELWEIIFSDNSKILATKNHRWVVNKRKNSITTDKLTGHDIPFVCAPKPEINNEYMEGLMHGFVFGDGTKSGNKTCVQMFGAASNGMSDVFNSNGYKTSSPEYCESYVGKLPGHWKDLPFVESVSKSYLYGFFMGLLAADGHVDSRGAVYLYQSDKKTLEYVNEIAPLVGLLPTGNIKTHREKSPFDGTDKPLYALNLRRMSIDSGCLVNTIHRDNWNRAPKIKNKALRVISVKSTGKVKRTYCAIEKETETFVIGQGLLTKNCHVAGWRDRMSDHYSFVFDELMKGGGVGANYSDRFTKKYPAIKNLLDVHIVCDPEHDDYEALKDSLSSDYSYEWSGCIPIDDSREGWVDALVLLIDQAFSRNPQPLVFDVSRVRPYGAPIRSFGGTASGPGALVRMIIEIANLLNSRVGTKLTSLDHMEMDHRIAMCVVAGNVRRSARMSIKHWKDPDIFEFIACKNDEARVSHWTTNISVEIDNAFFRAFKKGDAHAKALYSECISSMHKGGEPGFCNMSLAQHGEVEEVVSSNPCVTSDTWIMTTEGPKQVSDLLGRKFTAIVNGKEFDSTKDGFFFTGNKDVFEVTTDKGFKFKCTDNHKLPVVSSLKINKIDIKWKELSDVSTGDILSISNHGKLSWGGAGDDGLGWLIGSWLGDGTTSNGSAKLQYWGDSSKEMCGHAIALVRDSVKTTRNLGINRANSCTKSKSITTKGLYRVICDLGIADKELNDRLEKMSSNFYEGFLRGWFDADGSIQGNLTKGISVRLASSKLRNLHVAQRMLSRLGIISKVYSNRREAGPRLLPDGNGGKKLFDCNADHELIVSCDNIVRFADAVGFREPEKMSKLLNLIESYKRAPNRERFIDTIIKITKIGETKVFDCQIPGANEFCGNGVRLHNCGEIFLLPFENCNLGHVNLGEFYDSVDKAKQAFIMMTRFLIRATFGDIYSPWQQEVVKRNRRIGVGFFGFQDWLCKQGKKYSECHNDQEVQQNLRLFYRAVKRTAMEYAHQLRIPAPIKNTALAPTGSIAKLPGATEGCQALLFPYYEQRMRHQKDDPNIPGLMMDGVEFEECINKEEGINTIIAKHICKHPLVDDVAALGYDADDIVEGQNEISVHDTLAIQAMLQREWADNAISLTVNLTSATTEKELYHTMIKFLPKLKGTTVLVGAGGRAQPPYTEISREEYETYEGRKIVMDTTGQCSNGVCPVK